MLFFVQGVVDGVGKFEALALRTFSSARRQMPPTNASIWSRVLLDGRAKVVATVSVSDKGRPSRVEGEGRVGCGPRGKACAVPTTVHGPWTFATWTAAPLESQKEVTEAERERGEKELFNKMSTKKKTKKTVLPLFFLFAVQSLPNSPPPTALSKQLQWPSSRRLLCA